MRQGCVYLVGAGCGSADLITLRGAALLRRCDTVVYDDLIDPNLLELAPRQAERLYMGKRRGVPSAAQEDICAVLIERAQAGRTVVRLKGGDPFVFGRGGEEMLALREAGVPCEAVPGISSAIAIPEEAGIPVTHRGLSRGVHIVTAQGADGSLPEDLGALARLEGTLVFLMGLQRLPCLAEGLLAAGKAPDTPAAVLSGGNAPHPAAVRGTLADIAERARTVRPPAVIVVGPAAQLTLTSTIRRPLARVTVGLTGTAAVTQKLRLALEPLGARTFPAERSLVVPLEPGELPLEGWLVFTSANGVEVFFRLLAERGIDLRRLAACRFAVIGRGTASALERRGFHPDLRPETATTAALAQALLSEVPAGERLWLLRSAHGEAALAQALEAAYRVQEVPLYRLEADPATAERAKARLGEMDFLTFASASGVELYFQAHGAVPEGCTCACIGPVTAEALRRRYDRPFLQAADISARSLAETILSAVRPEQG